MRRLRRIVVAILAVIGFFAILGVGGGVWTAVALFDGEDAKPPAHLVLTLDLDTRFHESDESSPLAQLQDGRDYRMRDVVAAIDAAATDPRVVALFATAGQTRLSPAQAQEIRDVVGRFRRSGKPAVLFAPSLGGAVNGTMDTYLASAFGQVWMQPSGEVGLVGFSVESPFVKGSLDLLGVEPQFAGRKEYKSAIEMFTQTGPSAPAREAMTKILSTWTDQVVTGIAQGRAQPEEKVRALFGKGPFLATEALSAGLVDKLGYRDEAWQAAAGGHVRRPGLDVAQYAASLTPAKGPRVAVVTGAGTIQRKGGGMWSDDQVFSADQVAKALREAIDDPAIKAIVLRIDSPGGDYVAADTVWNEVRRARAAGKPVVASMAGTAASGGYFVAMGANRIVAQPGTITGSIGVFSGKFALNGLWEKLGIAWGGVKSGDNADMYSANAPFSPQGWERLNATLDAVYADFTTKAAQGRSMAPEKMEELARGRVWTGADAQARGLVDVLGGWAQTLDETRALLHLEAGAPLSLVDLPKPTPLQMLARGLKAGKLIEDEDTRALARLARLATPLAETLERVQTRTGAPLLLAPDLAR